MTLPGFIFTLYLAWTDIRTRLVPRSIVLLGFLVQGLTLVVYSLAGHGIAPLVTAVVLCLGSTGIQFFLALVRPGALGLGDVTATALLAFTIGLLGWTTTLVWWLLMGVFGLGSLVVGRIGKDRGKRADTLAFVPVILVAAAIATAATALLGG